MDAQLQHKIPALVLKIMVRSAVKVRRWVRTYVNPVWWQRNSFNFRGKNRERLGSSYYANVLMFYLEGEKKKPLDSLWQLWQNTETGKDVFVLILYISLVVLKRYPLYKTILCLVRWETCHLAAFLMVIYRCLFWVLSALRRLQRLPQRTFRSSAAFSSAHLMRSNLGGSAER